MKRMKVVNESISDIPRNKFSLTAIYLKDKKGYVVYFSEFPDTFAQGKTKKEALETLIHTIDVVLKHKEKDNKFKNSFSEEIVFQEVI
jgi:predicted RNase H-like HicB family nuclease